MAGCQGEIKQGSREETKDRGQGFEGSSERMKKRVQGDNAKYSE
jgi:hypothetical protein